MTKNIVVIGILAIMMLVRCNTHGRVKNSAEWIPNQHRFGLDSTWKEYSRIGDSSFMEIKFEKFANDTSWEYWGNVVCQLRDCKYLFAASQKSYVDMDYVVVIRLDSLRSPLYSFRCIKEDYPDSPDFLFGYYEFLYEKMAYDSSELRFFLKHRDSLRKVPGAFLKDLPSSY